MKNAGSPGPPLSFSERRVATASLTSPSATSASAMPINAETSVSILPCPYGCELSGGADQYFTPKITARSVARSERLWTASAIRA